MEFDRAYALPSERFLSGKEELTNLLLWLERWTDMPKQASGRERNYSIKLQLKAENVPVTAQVRVFRETGKLRDRIPVIRELTGETDGIGLFLEEGSYRIEVSGGPAWCRAEKRIRLPEDRNKRMELQLEPIGCLPSGWIFGDLHHHSIYSSPVYGGTDAVTETTEQVKKAMKAAGCGFGALSDHHNTFNHEEWDGEKELDFCPILSKEISTSNGHVMALGAKKDIIYRIPEERDRTPLYLEREFVRTAEEIRREGGVPQINHPFDTSVSTAWNRDFDRILSSFGAVEVYNGAHPMLGTNGNGKALEWWLGRRREGYRLTATAGSDTHNIRAGQYDGDLLKICEILEILEQRREQLPAGIQEKAAVLEQMGRRSLPAFLDWAGRQLGSACAITGVHLKEDRSRGEALDPKDILSAVWKGRVMITDGPLLFLEADGAGPGEKRAEHASKADVKIRVFSEEGPMRFLLFLSDGRTLEMEGKQFSQTGPHSYELHLEEFRIENAEWLAGALKSEQGYRAVVNPVYL